MTSTPSIPFLWRFVLLSLVYLVAAFVGLTFHMTHDFATLIWPPTGVALAALFLWGYELWPAIMLAAFIAGLLLGVSVPVAVGIALGNTLEALAGVYFLRKIVMLDPMLGRLHDTIGLLATCVSVTMLSVSCSVISLVLGGVVSIPDAPETWFGWWLGDSIAALVLTPFLIRWCWRPFFKRTPQEFFEGGMALGSLLAADTVAFWSPLARFHVVPLAYIVAPLLWISLRLGPRGITLANVVTAVFALASTYFGHGIFTQGTTAENLFLTQGFICIISIVFLIFASSVEEHRESERSLEGHIGALEDAVERASSEDKAKTDFLAILAHELRNPLAPIISAVEMVRINGVRPENTELFNTIEMQVRTLGRLLDDLLDISRISLKKLILKKEHVELQSVLSHAIETVKPFIETRKHTLSVIFPEESVWLYGDPIRLAQIFVNILYNAAKYTNLGGTITLTCQRYKHTIRVLVADTGIGIEPHLFKKIFEPFVQGTGAITSAGTGLGIGLALTKQLVELHGGSIAVASEGTGAGSVFTITLPVVTAPLSAPPQKQGELPLTDATAFSILIVDDNEMAALGLRRLLEHKGHSVGVAYSGAAALEYSSERHPQAVVLDIGLPDMSGYEVARRLRAARGESFLLIALSGYGQQEDKDRSRAAGFDQHLTKPVRVDDVERVLQQYSMRTVAK